MCSNNQPSELSGCPNVEILIVNQDFKGLDVRMTFRDGGICENQTIRRLTVEHNGMIVYECSNILSNQDSPCESNGKFTVIADPQCESDNLQDCKFNFFLNLTDFNVSDVGRYVAMVQVMEDGLQRREMMKSFDLFMDQGTYKVLMM